MALRSVLLRVVLSLSLALNGTTAAAAGARMQMSHADMQQPTGSASVADMPISDAMPCHHHDAGVSDSGGMEHQIATDPAPAKSKHPPPDCCKPGMCQCACVYSVQATLPALTTAGLVTEHSLSARPLTLAHAEPAIPHLIRPPIG